MAGAARRLVIVLIGVWLTLFGPSPPIATHPNDRVVSAQEGRILAIVGRQAAWLNLVVPRPQVLTSLAAPSFVMDVAALPTQPHALLGVVQPLGGASGGEMGGDLLLLDLGGQSGLSEFVTRADSGEWLGAPTWMPDGSGVLFQREDLRAGPDLYAGQAEVRYPSRIEWVSANGQSRLVISDSGFNPSPSPDGAEVAFIRISQRGPSLVAHHMPSGEERTIVPSGLQPDFAYPRYSPDGQQLAFLATIPSNGLPADPLAKLEIGPKSAFAHGQPWDLWIVGRDGSGLRRLATVGADDGSLAWSPDGSEIFVYGSTGARLVEVPSGETTPMTYLAGFGAISWLP